MLSVQRNDTLCDKTNLACDVAVRVEKAERVVCAAVDRNTNLSDIIVRVRRCLCSSEWTLVIRVADVELVVICGVWL